MWHPLAHTTWFQTALIELGVLVLAGLAAYLTAPWWWRWVFERIFRRSVRVLFEDTYTSNLAEGLTAIRKFGIQWVIENELRAREGVPLSKPIGTTRQFPHFDGLLFIPAQLHRRPLNHQAAVDSQTIIGRRAQRPMVLAMPILVSAMGYGVALSKPFVRALMKGAAMADTASNTGQGAWLPEFRELAKHLVVQVHDAPWRPSGEALRTADMIEVRLGQGANAGCGTLILPQDLTPDVAQDFGLPDAVNTGAYIPAGVPEADHLRTLRMLVRDLRRVSGGAPIAVKLAAGHHLERDLAIAVRAGFDVIVVDGAQGGTHSAPAILVDDFGLPTLAALCRAQRFLVDHGCRDRVDLIISGGLRTPGDMLKALALGADAVYIGAAALFAATHTQIVHAIPFEPPTSLAWTKGSLRERFDEDRGAKSLAQFLTSCADEMKLGARALGKTALRDVDATDLVAWQADVARITGLPLV
ncbi:FMN-binding glutamate synthase family protein [Alicyclobacillus macrosporangiidus]|uniref:Glutamate synthase domain-containing protein 2 n=1 Tax=Alicyclobacillus macrosporangiidus TaxID=392015 RepID=A0A1I7LAZ4_9BACL|nr:FMN-binding glutamate synthase family protein [Alicyclobacillus macrosporangiidus]SFV06674.1 Glutamate synthase domain-containing protein 2 [Alicyclobacillus macrosporangiidus]